jgi:hypothetical protein
MIPDLNLPSAIVISDTNSEAVLTALQPPEMKRRMVRVPLPKVIVLHRELLDLIWQSMK